MKLGVHIRTSLLVTVLLVLLRPVYANGGHVHLGGIFFLLLGGVVFIGGLVVIFYLLLRAEPEEAQEEHDYE